jgi:hypothetical protein
VLDEGTVAVGGEIGRRMHDDGERAGVASVPRVFLYVRVEGPAAAARSRCAARPASSARRVRASSRRPAAR